MTAPTQHPRTPYPPVPPQPYPYQPYAPYQQHQPGPYQQFQPGPYPPYGHPPYGHPPFGRPAPSGPRPWVVALVVGVIATVLAGIVLAATAASGSNRSAAPTPGGIPTGETRGTGETGTTGGQCPGGSLEGCYSEAQMQQFLGQAIRFVHGFSTDRHSAMPKPAGYQLIGAGRTAQSACGALDTMTYAYCPADDRIYIGQKQLWQFYSEIGDAAAVVGLAHEYGHHMQRVAGVPDDRSSAGQIRHENQADCIAGAFVGWARDKGFLEDSDAQDISGLVAAIASSENDPDRDHGTLKERAASMSTGIRDGLPGCSAFYPGNPVHQG